MPQPLLNVLEGDAVGQQQAGTAVPLRYNYDKPEKPRISRVFGYLRKMAIDGYVVKLDLPELRELVSLLRYSSNNLNQLTRRAHETGRIYETDLEDIQQSQERIWTAVEKIVSSLAALK